MPAHKKEYIIEFFLPKLGLSMIIAAVMIAGKVIIMIQTISKNASPDSSPLPK